jgi:hypothetical protein
MLSLTLKLPTGTFHFKKEMRETMKTLRDKDKATTRNQPIESTYDNVQKD